MAREVGVTRARIWQVENQGGTFENVTLLKLWEKHGRRLRRLGYTLDDLLTAKPDGDDAGAASAPAGRRCRAVV